MVRNFDVDHFLYVSCDWWRLADVGLFLGSVEMVRRYPSEALSVTQTNSAAFA